MRHRRTLSLLLLLTFGFAPRSGGRQIQNSDSLKTFWATRETPAEASAEDAARRDPAAYRLPPDKLRKAIALHRIEEVLSIADSVWVPVQLLLILSLGVAAGLRDVVLQLSGNRWAQGFAFVGLLLLLIGLLNLPLEIYGHHVALIYGLSVQGWGSWLADKSKIFALEWVIGGLLTMLMFWVIRCSPGRWWFWFWIPAVLVVVGGVFVTPYVIDPLFNKFEPLAQSDPALVRQLEQVVARSGMPVPPDRMFLMRASAKYTGLNAYVTGFGESKRIVVWDTTLEKSSPDEIAFIFAHELGHYALGHVVTGTVLTCLALLPFFWLGHRGVQLLLEWFGSAWRIPSQQDWGALVVLLLVLTVLGTLAEPIANGFSRAIEHNADVYGQEAVHGIVAAPQAIGLRSFQVLGEESLDDPAPHPVFDLWFGSHPPIWFRAAFAKAYDPWVAGEYPKYFAK